MSDKTEFGIRFICLFIHDVWLRVVIILVGM